MNELAHHLNSALIIQLLLHVQALIAGHHFHSWLWITCTSHNALPQLRTSGCTIVRITQHSAKINW